MATLLIDKIRDVLLTEGTLAEDTLAALPAPASENINRLAVVRDAPDAGFYYSNGTSWLPVPTGVTDPPISVAATRMRVIVAGSSEVVESSVGASGAIWPVYNFTDGTGNPRVAVMVWVPEDWASVEAHLDWSVASTSGGATRWTAEILPLTGALGNPAGDTFGLTVTNPVAAATPARSSLGTTAVTGGQWYVLAVSRNNGHAADTYTGTASLHGVTLTRLA